MRVTLVDLQGSLVDAARTQGWRDVELLGHTDVRCVSMTRDGIRTGYVSPMDGGGIDYALSAIMFPGVEGRVNAAIAAVGFRTHYLPIGCAFVVPALDLVFENPPRIVLVAAPTMRSPQQDVHGTHNAYSAMYAALVAAEAAGVDRLIVPGLCTGRGMMCASVAIAQMRRAHGDFRAGRPARYDAAAIAAEQPEESNSVWIQDRSYVAGARCGV